MSSPKFAGREFTGPSWATWRIIARLIDGDAHLLAPADRETALRLTGRTTLPIVAPREVYIGAGRRGGKSRFESLVAVWLAAQQYPNLSPGERAIVAHVAPDRRQASIDLDYARGLVEGSKLLRAALESSTTDTLTFRHRTQLEVATASYRTVRGRTLAGAVIDESAFLRSEDSALPDVELVRALRPALLTLNGLLLVVSSPHRKVGLLYNAHRKYYGNDDEPRGLFIQASSRDLNPTLDEPAIAEAMEDDPSAAQSEYLGVFRADLEGFLDDATVDAAIATGRRELPRVAGARYRAFCDSSGRRSDSFTLAIAHQVPKRGDTPERLVLDAVRTVAPPFDPESAVEPMVQTLRDFGLSEVSGDAYAAEWVVGAFRKHGITYRPSERSRSEIYLEILPHFSRGAVELLDSPQLRTQLLLLLERRTRAGGRDSVDHPRGGHDDLATSVCGALLAAASKTAGFFRPEMFLEAGEPVVATRAPDCCFAVIGTPRETGPNRAAAVAVHFARSRFGGVPLMIVDYDLAERAEALNGNWIFDVARRLGAWANALHSSCAGIWVEPTPIGTPLLELGSRRGLEIFDITKELPTLPPTLAERVNAAAPFIASGQLVRIGVDAQEKRVAFRGLEANLLLPSILSYSSELPDSDQPAELLHAICIATLISFKDDPRAGLVAEEAGAAMPVELHGPQFSRTAGSLAERRPTPPPPGPSRADRVAKYEADLAVWQKREREGVEKIRARLKNPTWRPRSWHQLDIGPPPENAASAIPVHAVPGDEL
jgi:hypothetical protein